MKLIFPKFEIIEQQAGLEGMYKQIELAGRVSHKSEDMITEDSAKKFVDNMIKLGHGATLEFGTVYLKFPILANDKHLYHRAIEYDKNPYSKVRIAFEENGQPIHANNGYYITTNLRVLIENDWMDDLQYLCEPTKHHEKRHCVKFICDRGVSHEFVRHRVMSFLQESTRYCNYSKNKFSNNVTCIIPSWCNLKEGYYGYELEQNVSIYDGNPAIKEGYLYSNKEIKTEEDADNAEFINDENTPLINSLVISESCYFSLLDNNWKPQQARQVLPTSLKTELYMCGFANDWKHFFDLRDAGSAHPDAQALAKPLHEEFIKRNYIKD